MSYNPSYEELEQKVAALQEEVSRTDALRHLLFENSIFLIAYISPKGVILTVNQFFAANLNGKPEDFIGKSIHECLPQIADGLMEEINEVVSSGKGVVFDSFIRLGSDNYWFTTELQPSINHAGEIINVQLVSQDITRRKKNEELVAIFAKIAERSEQSIGMMDLDGNFTYVTPSLCWHLGETDPANAVGKGLIEYIPKAQKAKILKECLPTVMEKGHWTGELDFISINGKITHTIQHIFLIRDRSQRPFYIANIMTDITAYQRFNQVTLQKEKLETLGSIASEVAHEIRNPLVSIGGFARRLKSKFTNSYECDIILKEAKRLENILSRIKNYLDPRELHLEECRLDNMIHECLQLLSPELKAKQITYTVQMFRELPAIYADRQIMGKIFINLIRNAKDAMSPGGVLHIKAFDSDHDIHMEFINQADGDKAKYADSFFMPFSEGSEGISLPLCYRLIKDMGGILSFAQEQGAAIFTLTLPKTTLGKQPWGKEQKVNRIYG